MSIKVMLVDDHVLMREGIKQLLEFDGSVEVIEEAGNGQECVDKLNHVIPDVLLLDINMPVMNGLEVLQYIREKHIDVKVLILTVHNEVEYLMKAVDIGVNGYILKDSESTELKKAIMNIVEGDNYIQPELIAKMNENQEVRDSDKEKIASLSDREIEVLINIVNGLLNKEIASNLNISERTVKNHISNIFKKLDVCDRTQAAVFAIKNNIVDIF